MPKRSLIAVASVFALLLVGAVGLYLYDHGRRDHLANGVKIAGIKVGGMNASAAGDKVRRELTARLNQPIVVQRAHQRFELSPRSANVGYDIQATIDEATRRSREGSIFTRTWHSVQGSAVNVNLAPKISYSRPAVTHFVRRVTGKIDRPARDASLDYSAGGLSKVPGRDGLKVNATQLRNAIVFDLENQRYQGALTPVVSRLRPKVTTAQLADRYPSVIVINRSSFELKLYKHLKMSKSYGIAVGQAGLESPAGLHSVTDKSIDPAWNVPNESWAGSLAGQTIPGGAPENPIKSRWIGFYPGDGIHGTADDASIGSAASHGCIRMHVSDVEDLFPRVSVGDPVYVI
ncbi:MAG: L,D-transpeptidase/peptidoglycan binding protein [Actinomycetota bacterium]|nr:L,D-transpeptidase/peptidoglycan binding protein [Actinomycetota bacterium]